MRPAPEMAMSQFTTLPTSFEDDIELCRNVPIRSLELCEAKLDRNPAKARGQLEALRDAGVELVSFQPRVHSLFPDSMAPTPTDPEERVQAMCDGIDRIAEVFHPQGLPCVVIGGAVPDGDLRKAYETARLLLPKICDHAGKYGFTVAFETIHPLLMNHDTFTWKLEDAWRLLEDVDREEMGLVIDVWHVFWEHGLADKLRRMAPRVRVVHLSDFPKELPRNFMDRLVMGTGIVDLPMIFRALDEGGYAGPYCLELLSDKSLPDSLWNWPPEKLVAENRKAFKRLWEEAQEQKPEALKP